jgi:4-hydroxy-tetrahydrodipicolinate synthase
MKKNIYTGLITALITPFKNGAIDHASLANLITVQIKAGVNALVVGGSTGEGSSLNEHDYFDLIKSATDIAGGRIPLIAGISAISTESAIDKVKKLNELKIDGIMSVPPLYIRPEQEGIIQHFKAIHDATEFPIILYANPGRVGCEFTDETILKLAENERIIALKDAGSDIERPLRLSTKLPAHFNMLTGDDGKSVVYSAHGGKGCVSVVSNILPNQCALLQSYLRDGNFSKALDLQQKLLPIYQATFSESNPIGVKYAAYLLKLCSDEIKLPLTIMRPDNGQNLEKILKEFGKM